MKFTISRDPLHAALAAVARAVEASTIPILANALLQTSGEALLLRASDLDIEILARAAAKIEGGGEITVSARALRDIVAKMSAGADIGFELDDARLIIRSGRARFVLQTLPAADFPDFAAVAATHSFAISAKALGALIDACACAISTEETRYYLNGIFIHIPESAKRLRFVATDGHRLALVEGPEAAGAEGMPAIIVPRKAIAEIARLAAKAEGDVEIALSSAKLAATFADGTRLTTKLIDGTFPEYSRVVPYANPLHATADRALLAAALDRVATITSARGGAVKLTVRDATLTLSVVNPDAGESRDEIEVDVLADGDGDEIEIGFNARYLAEILAAVAADRVTLDLASPADPTLIHSADGGDSKFVLMPLRV